MSFSPDEIAKRAFSPSADGYHQIEVRDFLRRVAAQVHDAQAAEPQAPPPPPAPATTEAPVTATATAPTIDNRANPVLDTRVAALETRLDQISAQLAELRTILVATSASVAAVPGAQRASSPGASEPRVASRRADTAPKPAAPLEPAASPSRRGIAADPLFARPSADSPTAAAAHAMAPTSPPSTSPATPPVVRERALPRVSQDRLGAALPEPDSELFTESAHDLLDGVVDDVMGQIATDLENP